jgi:hypothetical protein
MPKFTVYAPPYQNQRGKIVQPQIQITAINCYKYYAPYSYFASHLSERPFTKAIKSSKESTANELLARAHRIILFADSMCFKPVQYNDKQFGNLVKRLYEAGSSEHVSFWKSSLGTKFIIIEPYNLEPNYFLNLGNQGLIAIPLTTNLSPYCGGWNPSPGAKPKTTSYLICDYKNLAELRGWEIRLRNAIYIRSSFNSLSPPLAIPAWNFVKGIHHV